MSIRTLAMIGLLGFGAAGTMYTPLAEARTHIGVNFYIPAPPAPRYERVVVRPGYTWIGGYWVWNNRSHRHVWRNGYYARERVGYAWSAPRWYQGDRGHWHMREGYWDRRDHDRRDHDHDRHDHDHDRHDHDHDHDRHH